MRPTALDRAIGWLAPRTALKRVQARALLEAGGKRFEAATAAREQGWTALGSGTDPTAQAVEAAYELRSAARQLEQDDPFAVSGLAKWTSNATPISGRAQVPGVTGPNAKAVHEPIDRLWWEQCQRLGADGQSNEATLQKQVLHGLIRDGEILARRIDRDSRFDLPLPFQVQLLEAEFLDASRDRQLDGGGLVMGGIQFDARGVRQGYWLHREHPGANRAFTRRNDQPVFVPADEISHIYEPTTYGLQRGVTWFAPVIMTARDSADYARAERMRKKIQACYAAFVHGFSDDETIGPVVTDSSGKAVETLFPGMIGYVRGAGGSVTFGEPKDGGGYTEFQRDQRLAYAAGLHLTYELLSGDLSNVSFISGRLGLLAFRKRVRQVQDTVLIPRWSETLWRWFLMYGQGLGRVRQGTVWARWSPPRWESVQPLEEAQADELELKIGTLSPQEALAKRGIDAMEFLDEWEAWKAELERRGLEFLAPALTAASLAAAPPAPPSVPRIAPPAKRLNGHASKESLQ